jgi:HSP20 family protein
LVGNELAISGELKEKERNGVMRRSTRHTGRFDYRVALPEPVEAAKVEASLHDGVLTVRAPKTAPPQRHKIELKAG